MVNVWEYAKSVSVRTGKEIVGGFDVGFDTRIPDATKDVLMDFVYWVEDRYHIPVTLWVDFKWNHYLIGTDQKRTGYRFYWVDYQSLDCFDSFDDIPVIELAVRTENRAMNEILRSFVEAVTCYFAWLCGMDMKLFRPDDALAEEILQSYDTRGEC